MDSYRINTAIFWATLTLASFYSASNAEYLWVRFLMLAMMSVSLWKLDSARRKPRNDR